MKQTPVSNDTELIVDVLRLRYWQHIMNEALKRREFTIPIHLGFGHEAIAAAVSRMMQKDDQLVLTHRNITYNLARARSLEPLYKEYKLSPSAVGGGKLGSMNLASSDWGVAYTSCILGNNLSVACGLALSRQTAGREGVVTVLTGDGAMEEGQFYESLVFARSQRLKVLFVVENNDSAMSSCITERRCPIALDRMSEALGIPFLHLATNDVIEYTAILGDLRRGIDNNSTPACIEVRLAALNQHAGPTPGWPTDPKRISIEDGLIIERTSNDPVFVLIQRLGHDLISKLSISVFDEGWTVQ
jgi:TPP-dependent pyruvate/acetoin dehydrogenase alpha subunit